LDLIDIALVVVSVWVLFVTCVLALLKAAQAGDEVIDGETPRRPTPGGPGWRVATPATTQRRGRHRQPHQADSKYTMHRDEYAGSNRQAV